MESPVYCRITVSGKRAEFSTGIFTSLNKWNKGKIKSSETQTSLLNRIISDVNEIKNRFVFNNIDFTADMIKKTYLFKTPIISEGLTTQQLSDAFFTNEKTNGKLDSKAIARYKARFKIFLDYLSETKSDKLTVIEITSQIADELTDCMLYKMKFSPAYAVKVIQIAKRVFNFGVNKRFVTQNPFAFVKIKSKQKPLIVLSKEELNTMMKHKFAAIRLQQVADLFLLQCFTGMAYVDLMNFDKKTHLQNGFICINRQKSETESLIPILPQTKTLLEKYNYEVPRISNQKYNSYIKEVAEVTGITKPLTTHVGRKTCGSILLNEGVSIEVVSRILGHRDTKITQHIYAKVNELRISREMECIDLEIKQEVKPDAVQLELLL